ncbi:MAG: amino acid ABC transporter ATP-binding protein [Clostridia bacterium]|nr:amino acid ABC transporter ATP-binding protein [Clostridia bacterium]
MAFFEIRNLKKRFGNVQVLHGINFSMEKGEAVAVIGSSGGGKTTFLRCLNFLEMADEGTIHIEGGFDFDAEKTYTDSEIRAMRLKMGLVFQSFNLFPQYTALDNIAIPLQLRTVEKIKAELPRGKARRSAISAAREENRARARELLSMVGLSDKEGNYPWQLSGGQQQRVAIARALAQTPAVLCFDEPTSALDPELTGEVLRVIKELKDQGCTLLVVTHEMDFARNVADRVVFVADGLIEEEGTPEQLFTAPNSPKTAAFLQHSLNL